MTYEEQLENPSWKRKRYKILRRDNYECQCCKISKADGATLHVHHTYYLYDHYAWQYDDSALITYCSQCHAEFHENNEVPIYIERNGKKINMNFTPCVRCNGMGYFPEYKKIENGICFRCRGARYEELIESKMFDLENYLDELEKNQTKEEIPNTDKIKKVRKSRSKVEPDSKSTEKFKSKTSKAKSNTSKVKSAGSSNSGEKNLYEIYSSVNLEKLDVKSKGKKTISYNFIDLEKKSDMTVLLESIEENRKKLDEKYKVLEQGINEAKERKRKQDEADKRFWVGIAVFLGITTLMCLILAAINS